MPFSREPTACYSIDFSQYIQNIQYYALKSHFQNSNWEILLLKTRSFVKLKWKFIRELAQREAL